MGGLIAKIRLLLKEKKKKKKATTVRLTGPSGWIQLSICF